MTKKDYEAIAAAIAHTKMLADSNGYGAYSTLEEVAEQLAAVMAADNERFDRARFLKACGV